MRMCLQCHLLLEDIGGVLHLIQILSIRGVEFRKQHFYKHKSIAQVMHMTATIAIRSRDSSSGIGCWWSVSIGPRQWLIRKTSERSESCSSTAPCWRREQGHSGTVAPIDVSTQHPSVLSSCEPSEKKTCLACKSLQHLFFFFINSCFF